MATPFFRRKVIRVGTVLVLLFVLIQFYRPALPNPPVTADLEAPGEVRAILKRACYDCHSNETNLRWYDQPAPAYWLVADDVKKGRKVLNFSNWDSLTDDQRQSKLFEAFNQIVFHSMPLSQYTMVHRSAKLNESDVEVLKKWLAGRAMALAMDTVKMIAARKQYDGWTAGGLMADSVLYRRSHVSPAPNGLAFMPDYRDWTPVSTTERWDNGTMRVIMGNPVAVQAIKEGKTNPWPDGTIFAKIAWDQLQDSSGIIEPGLYKQVEFMMKDRQKYAETGGWGWGRWKGTNFTPYGKNASFTGECVRCHQPMKDYDLVFSMPENWRSKEGTGANDSIYEVLGWKLITSRIELREKQMSTLYGNELAVKAMRTSIVGHFPAGAQLAMVTWKRKEDPHWFGAEIPESIERVETVRFDVSGEPVYARFEGSPLKEITFDPSLRKMRTDFIVSQQASVMP